MTSLSNSVHLIGRLGTDPKIYEFDNGKMKAVFSLATSDFYNDSHGKRVEETQWHNIVVWNKSAKIAVDYLSKGKEIALEGKLTHSSYEDKEGNKKYITEVIGNQFMIIGKKNQV